MKPQNASRTRRRRPRAAVDRRAARAGASFARLVRLMDTLRSPRGCPWDRKQTHRTLRPFLLEEAYEALDAIDRRDFDDLAGELGDVLFQCVFHAQLAAEAHRFDIGDAIDAIADKLVRRHPHVFTPAGRPLPTRRGQIRSSRAVVEQWEKLKARERGATGASTGILDGIPRSMAALLRAHEIGSRVGAVGFDWPRAADVLDKIDEEVRELREAANESDARAAEELGDLLFSIANLARKLGVEPESALREANDKFSRRFALVERALAAQGRDLHDASLEEMEAAWHQAKHAAAAAKPSRSRSRRAR